MTDPAAQVREILRLRGLGWRENVDAIVDDLLAWHTARVDEWKAHIVEPETGVCLVCRGSNPLCPCRQRGREG